MASRDPSIRASDEDRESTAAELRDHYAAGRLTSDEFNERLDKAYAAKTLGDLAALKTDLPAPASAGLGQLPEPIQPAGPVAAGSDRFPVAWRAAWGSWASVSLILFVIWALSGGGGNLWFLWPVGICGALLLGRMVTGGPPPGRYGRTMRKQYRHDYRRYRRGF